MFTVNRENKVTVDISTIPPIPKGGFSLPITVSVSNAPAEDLEIVISLAEGVVGLQTKPQSIDLPRGNISADFLIYADTYLETDKSTVSFKLQGTDASSFLLKSSKIQFSIRNKDTTPPKISRLELKYSQRTTATFEISVTDVCVVYYAWALRGTIYPDIQSVIDQEVPQYDTTETEYGNIKIGEEQEATFQITGLRAQTNYTLYVYLEDLGGNQLSIPKTKDFTTLNRYYAADFQLRFTQTNINDVETFLARDACAFLLSLPISRVIEKKYQDSGSATRQLADDSTALNLQIVEDPEVTQYPQPLELANMLNGLRDEIDLQLTHFDKTQPIVGTQVSVQSISFTINPQLTDADHYDIIEFSVELSDYGWIYAVAIAQDNNSTSVTSFQISKNLDAFNRPSKGIIYEYEIVGLTTLSITDLEDGVMYAVYVTAGNSYPGFPDLLSDDQVVVLNKETLSRYIPPDLQVQSATLYHVNFALLALLILKVYFI